MARDRSYAYDDDDGGHAPREAHRRARIGLLALVLLLTSIGGLAVGLWYPNPAEGDSYTYAQIRPIRSAWWGWHVFAGANIVVGVCASALAGWLLVKARGALLATVGGSMMWLGAALYGVGLGGLATIFYFGTEAAAIDEVSGAKLFEYVNDHVARLYGPAIAGAALVALGTIFLAVALWRAKTVPRWVPVLLATLPITFVLPPNEPAGLVVEALVAVATAALGWYTWRHEARPRVAATPG